MAKAEETKEGLAVYEIGYLVLPSIPEDQVSTVAEEIKKIISKAGGVEIDGEAPFKQPLAYSMSKTVGASRYVVSEAYLGWIKFEVEPVKVALIKDGVEKMEEILRLLIVKAPRQTDFTFAKARVAMAELENKEESDLPNSNEEMTTPVLEEVVK